ncbi:MAG TPA: kynurenine 3-monooxygenase [Cytophagales bacterium]|nr:kynurenine 3-monooxygenase [Cytophagales bacterium]HAP64853.1 kynurenine 3-monooxygenase [Cytophagales bacterium]
MSQRIAIMGAGLVGSLLANYLAKRGFQVSVYEKRPDPRKADLTAGRSINLALSHRGLRALDGVGLAEEVQKLVIPMKGRMMHDVEGNLTFQAYGREGQHINSISRNGLNELLIERAEQKGAQFHFGHKLMQVNPDQTEAHLLDEQGSEIRITPELLIGSDGAFSNVRKSFMHYDRFSYSQHYIEHGYKELTIPPTIGDNFALRPNALHIWPRRSYMLIALPNLDRSFTVTLFFPFEGRPSFDTVQNRDAMWNFFRGAFPDVVGLMPDLEHDFFHNPTSSLVTVQCFPWVKNRTLILGDASHAIVPFYGQGMNAGFEDCRVFDNYLEKYGTDWDKLLDAYQKERKPDADAISELALKNFTEMRDHVADESFLLRKKIEARLHELYPDEWMPLYSMVTFSDLRYSEALSLGKKQAKIMDGVMEQDGIFLEWEMLNFKKIVRQLRK